MATPQSSYIISHYKGFGGNFLDSQYLGAAFDTGKPHVFQSTLMKIFSSQNRFITGKPLTAITGGASNMTEIDTEIYRWTLQGADYKCARIVEVLEPSNTTPGINLTTFRIKVDLDYYMRPDVLLAEDNEFPLEIVDGPIQDGSGYIYTVRLQGDNPTTFLPVSNLEIGKEFSKGWTTVTSEFNEEWGTQQSPNLFQLESQIGFFAQKYEVTDKAWRNDGRMDFEILYTDAAGAEKRIKKFLPYAEYMMNEELTKSIEYQLTLGKRQTRPDATTGYWKKTGPGLREQLKDGWTEYYNGPITVNLLKDYLMDIYFARTDESDRDTVMMTGTVGADMFHTALASVAQSFFTVDSQYVRSTGTVNGTPQLSFGAQFTRYTGPHGVSISLTKNPLYDSREFCKKEHPLYPGKPIDSARFTILDFGSHKGESNISMVSEKNTFHYGYVPGTHTPTGPIKGGMGAAMKNGYDMWTAGSAGLWIKDVTRCGELIFDAE